MNSVSLHDILGIICALVFGVRALLWAERKVTAGK